MTFGLMDLTSGVCLALEFAIDCALKQMSSKGTEHHGKSCFRVIYGYEITIIGLSLLLKFSIEHIDLTYFALSTLLDLSVIVELLDSLFACSSIEKEIH